jgi:hypothetical protein
MTLSSNKKSPCSTLQMELGLSFDISVSAISYNVTYLSQAL